MRKRLVCPPSFAANLRPGPRAAASAQHCDYGGGLRGGAAATSTSTATGTATTDDDVVHRHRRHHEERPVYYERRHPPSPSRRLRLASRREPSGMYGWLGIVHKAAMSAGSPIRAYETMRGWWATAVRVLSLVLVLALVVPGAIHSAEAHRFAGTRTLPVRAHRSMHRRAIPMAARPATPTAAATRRVASDGSAWRLSAAGPGARPTRSRTSPSSPSRPDRLPRPPRA